MWGNSFGHFSALFELRTVLWAVFRYHSGKRTIKKVAPEEEKNTSIDIWVHKMCFSQMYIFRAPIGSEEPGMVSS